MGTQSKSINKDMFASDNYSGSCPTAWQAMETANHQVVNSYGDDIKTFGDELRNLAQAGK